MKHRPSFKRFSQALLPKRIPTPAELGKKIDTAMYAIKAAFQRRKMMEAAKNGTRDADR